MNIDEYKKRLRKDAAENHKAFTGKYKSEIEGLMNLSESEIAAIAPTTADREKYAQLITVVKEASANNMAQADLKSAIQDLGSTGISLARKVPGLSLLLG